MNGGRNDLLVLLENYLLGWKMQFDLLAIRNETFLQDLIFEDEVDSTNSALLRLAAEKSQKTPVLMLAERQTRGRGRGGNHWWSNDGALTFSILLDFPMLPPELLGSFSLTVGLAVCQTLEQRAPSADLAIKWPNDVYLNHKKLAGILMERPDANEPTLVVGIGVNLNNRMQGAPEDIRGRATSLLDECGEFIDPSAFLIDCLQQLERRCRDQVHHRSALLDQWRAYCYLTGKQVEVQTGSRTIRGECLGVDATGALQVASESGTETILSGVVLSF